jgi:diguanylate cyclase (GGDEF)-like protein
MALTQQQLSDVRGQRGPRHVPIGVSGVKHPPHPASSVDGFAAAAATALAHLQAVAPMTLWAVLRYDDGDCVLDSVTGPEADSVVSGFATGTRLPWSNMICSRMVEGRGPRVAADIRRVPAYAAAPIARRLPVGAYVGVPIRLPDGSLYGSICGLDPSPQPAEIADALPVAELLAKMLGMMQEAVSAAKQARDDAEQAERRAVTDALTGIANRLGWNEALESEQARASRRGLRTGLVSVDLDDLKRINDLHGHDAGDRLLTVAAKGLQAVVRREDVLARTGGDEFAVLVSDCDAACLDRFVARLRPVLDRVGVRASIGAVSVTPGTTLREAWKLADQAMYAEKHAFSSRKLSLDLVDEALRTG